jgi:dTDP-glucose pyrophosphorylase
MADWRRTLVAPEATIRVAMEAIDRSGARVALVAEPGGRLLGIVTDGDVRRAILRGVGLDSPAREIMNPRPVVAPADAPSAARRALLLERRLNQLPVLDAAGIVVGLERLDEVAAPPAREEWVVLMAGGLGTRLRPLTNDRPKPMLPVAGRPLLETIVAGLVVQGFQRLFLAVNYRAEMIRAHFGDGSRFGARIEYLTETSPLGTAGPLTLLPARPARPLVVMNADLLTAADFGRLVAFHDARAGAATIGVREFQLEIPYGVVQLEDDRMLGIEEKPVVSRFVSAGIYALAPEALARLEPGERCDMPDLLRRLTAAGDRVSVYPIREYWLDIGRLEDLERASAEFHRVFG